MGRYHTDPEVDAFLHRAARELPSKIGNSAMSVALIPSNGQPDPKFAVELGYMIMLDKPIIALVKHGCRVPNKLVLVADEIVEWNGSDDQAALMAAMDRVAARLGGAT